MNSIRTLLSNLTGKHPAGPAGEPEVDPREPVDTVQATTVEDKRAAPDQTEDSVATESLEEAADPDAGEVTDGIPRIDRIKIEGVIGEGGMGVVYLGHHETLDRKVAVKAIRTQDLKQARKTRERLRREAQALAKLNHPNIVQVHDFHENARGEVHVVMEYVDGSTLREWLEHKRRTVSEIVAVFLAAAQGLEAAHEAEIVHRDFKPDNVLIDRKGKVRVVDFGLARQGDETALDEQLGLGELSKKGRDLTQTGTLLGTPAYMSAEQWDGKRGDARSDQFAICVALFEALYGHRPFPGRTLKELKRRVKQGELDFPDRPSARGRVSRRLKKLLERGLARNPDARFPTMAELRLELHRTSQPVRRWRATAIIALSAVTIAAGASFYVRNQERWRVYQDTCLQPARVAYLRGDLRNARETLDNQTCIDVAPRGASVPASVRALEVMNHVLYGAEGELSLSAVTKRRRTADAFLAEALEALWRLRAANPKVGHEQLLAILDAQREQIDVLLERASDDEDSKTAAAPYGHLVVEAILAAGPDRDLEHEIDEKIKALEGSTGEIPFLLHYARQSLEPDHRLAIAMLRRLLDRAASNDELAQLIRAELAFRTALLVLATPDDASSRAEANELLAQAPMPSNPLLRAHLDLAYVAVSLPAETGNSTQLEAVRAAASRLWWDTRLWDALAQIEARIDEEARAKQFAEDLATLVVEVEAPAPNFAAIQAKLAELVARSRELELSPAQHEWLRWIEAAGMLGQGLERRDLRELRKVIAACESLDFDELPTTYTQRVQAVVEEARATLATLESASPRSTSPRRKSKLNVIFYPTRDGGVDYEVAGLPQFTITTPHKELLPEGKLAIRCCPFEGNMSSYRTFELGREGLEIECRADGPHAR